MGIKSISNPGKREKKGGVVLQFAKRSQQLNGIIDDIRAMLKANLIINADGVVQLSKLDCHKIDGMLEQVGIIADELEKAGK